MIKSKLSAANKCQSNGNKKTIFYSFKKHKAKKNSAETSKPTPKDFAQRELPPDQKQELSFINKLSCYSILLLSSLGIISCESAQKPKPIETVKVEKPKLEELQTLKLTKEDNNSISQLSFLDQESSKTQPKQETEKPKQEAKHITTEKQIIDTKSNKPQIVKANTDKEKFYYPDRDLEKFQEIISKFDFSFKDPEINQIANDFVAKLPFITKLIIEKYRGTTFSLYSDFDATKKIANVDLFFDNKTHHINKIDFKIYPPNDNKFSVISESTNFNRDGNVTHKEYFTTHKNSNESTRINQSPKRISITKSKEQDIEKEFNAYPPEYTIVEESFSETYFKKSYQKSSSSYSQYLTNPDRQKNWQNYLNDWQIAHWSKSDGELEHSYKTNFQQHPLGLIYQTKGYTKHSDKANFNIKIINIKGRHFLLKYEYKSEWLGNYPNIKIQCLESNLDKLTNSQTQGFPLYKVTVNHKNVKQQTIFANIDTSSEEYLDFIYELVYGHYLRKEKYTLGDLTIDQKNKYPKILTNKLKKLELSPTGNPKQKISIKNHGSYTSKKVYEDNQEVMFDLATVITAPYKKLKYREYYNKDKGLSLVNSCIQDRDSIGYEEKLNTSYRIIDIGDNKQISYKVETKVSEGKKGKILSKDKSFYLNNTPINIENQEESSTEIQAKLIKQIEPALDKFLDEILEFYKKEINEYGVLAASIKSILRTEQRKVLEEHLSTDHITDEATAFIAYANAIEAIKNYFTELCTEYDFSTDYPYKYKLTTKLERSIPKVPFLNTYIVDPEKLEKLMRQIFNDLDTRIVPVAYRELAKALKIEAHPNIDSVYKEVESFKKQITSREEK